MTIDLTCEKCEASFEVDAADILDAAEPIKCPNCNAKMPQAMVEEFSNALNDLCKVISAMRKKFAVSLALETDDLPPPYDEDGEDEEDEDEGDDGEDLLDSDEDDEEEEEVEEDRPRRRY
jgi:predicted Zn finger-like uncharacterized protein